MRFASLTQMPLALCKHAKRYMQIEIKSKRCMKEKVSPTAKDASEFIPMWESFFRLYPL